MCGIAGMVAASLPEGSGPVLEAMLASMIHRGPDGNGRVTGPGYAIGHCRLAIIDLQGGAQPLRSPCGRYVLSFNGEIYNYLELRAQLMATGEVFASRSDSEVLLRLLMRQGASCLDQLVGIFAFAFHDSQTGVTLLARDHLGVKPLYYTQTDQGALVFASEIKAILEHPHVSCRRDDQALFQYLTFQFTLDDSTLFAGIRKLEPGSIATYHGGSGRLEQRRYWSLDFHTDSSRSADDTIEDLRHSLDDSIRLQMRSDMPIGAYLSGGLDSSLVAAAAAKHQSAPLQVFHGRFAEGEGFDESLWARRVSDAIGADFHETVPTAADFVRELPGIIRMMDEPAAGPGVFPQVMVSKLAARSVKVVLGGQGGDELFAGYARYLVAYLEQALKGAIFGTSDEGRHVVTLETVIANLPVLRGYIPMLKGLWSDGLFDDMDRRYFSLIDRGHDMTSLLAPHLRDGLDKEALFAMFQAEFNRPDTRSYINKMTHFDLRTLLPALLHVEDRASMAASIESRVPLLDHRLVERAAQMVPTLKFGGGELKFGLRKVAEAFLPRDVVRRTDKMGFPVPLAQWMEKGPVRDFVHDVLTSQVARQRGLFEPTAVHRLLNARPGFDRQLWGILCLELWHQTFQVS